MYNNVYSNKKVLITGNTGFKGSWLTLWMLKLGAKVYGLSNGVPTNPSMFESLKLREKITFFEEDIRDLEAVKMIISTVKPDFVFHLAAQAIVSLSYSNPVDTITTNVVGTTNILEALRLSNQKCNAIIITSDKCYDNVEWIWGYKETDHLGGKDIYSGSKGAAELIIKSYYHSFFKKEDSNVRIASARAGNVIGGGDWAIDRIVPDCVRAWTKKKAVEIRNPNATRPWQHVLEPLSGYLTLGMFLDNDAKLNGDSYNFGPKSEHIHTVREILEDMSKYWDFKDSGEAYQVTGEIKFHEAGLLKLNCDKALYHLKWQSALDYSKLIEFTSLWYFKFYFSDEDMYNYTQTQIMEYEAFAKKK
jgi:CDP-glucose 4,6-dehydratase